MAQVEQVDARSKPDLRSARGDQRERRNHVEFRSRCEQMVGEPERIDAPFFGALGHARDSLGGRQPEAPQSDTDTDLDLFHVKALPCLPAVVLNTNMRRT